MDFASVANSADRVAFNFAFDRGTELEVASIGQIRLRLFKIAARLTTSVRRIHIELCSAYPLKALFALIHQRLGALHAPA